MLGLAAVQWLNPLLLGLFDLLPPLIGRLVLIVLTCVLALDVLGTALTLLGVRGALPRVEDLNSRLAALSVRMGEWILRHTEARIHRAYPAADFARRKRVKAANPFLQGNSFYSIALLFLVPTLFIIFQHLQEKVKPVEREACHDWQINAEQEVMDKTLDK